MPTINYKLSDGTRVPGTTTIISNLGWNKNALMIWANQEGLAGRKLYEKRDEAAAIGTIAHEMIECDLKEIEFDKTKYDSKLMEKAETAFLAWLEWKDFFELSKTQSELSLVSEKYGFGGTIDIATVKKVKSIIDLKTSSGTYEDYLIQIAAYGQLYNEHFPDEPIQAYYLLRLGKEDGSFHYHYYPDLTEAWEVFLNLLNIHKLKSTLKKRL